MPSPETLERRAHSQLGPVVVHRAAGVRAKHTAEVKHRCARPLRDVARRAIDVDRAQQFGLRMLGQSRARRLAAAARRASGLGAAPWASSMTRDTMPTIVSSISSAIHIATRRAPGQTPLLEVQTRRARTRARSETPARPSRRSPGRTPTRCRARASSDTANQSHRSPSGEIEQRSYR